MSAVYTKTLGIFDFIMKRTLIDVNVMLLCDVQSCPSDKDGLYHVKSKIFQSLFTYTTACTAQSKHCLSMQCCFSHELQDQ